MRSLYPADKKMGALYARQCRHTVAPMKTSYPNPCRTCPGPLVNVETTSRYGVASMRFFDRDGFGTASAGRLTIPLPLLGATAGRVVAVFRTMTATSRRNAGLDDVVTAMIAVAIGLDGP